MYIYAGCKQSGVAESIGIIVDRYLPGVPVCQSGPVTLSLMHAKSEVQSADFTE